MKIIYDILGRPTLVNDIHDSFSVQADFMIVLNQLNLQGLKQKIRVNVKKRASCSQTSEEEIWDLHL